MALLRNLSVLRLNGNRLGEECSFAPQRMLERNPDLARALAARQQRLEPFPSLQVGACVVGTYLWGRVSRSRVDEWVSAV